ncbi:MAG: hypothetical protein AAF626_06600 [Pseudomonadota bacterium]
MAIITVDQLDDDAAAEAAGTTLREAVLNATSGDTIVFDASLSGSTLTLTAGQITIDKDVTIDGGISSADNAADITISGGGASRIFLVNNNSTLNLDSLTLSGGDAGTSSGGAIRVDAGSTLTVDDSTFTSNIASRGGAIASDGQLTLNSTTFVGNTANDPFAAAAGALNVGANSSLIATNVTFFNNTAEAGVIGSAGGAINAEINSSASLINATITGNSATDSAGLSGADNVYTLTNTIVSGNSATMWQPGRPRCRNSLR